MKLIINADDFGLSKSISDGIIQAIQGGFVTSTSIMAKMPYARCAINQAVKYHISCIGLHVNLTVGKPIIANRNLMDDNGIFYYNRQQIENKKLTYEDVFCEVMAQLEKIEEYSNGTIKIDHLDTHHHLFDNPIIKQVILDIANNLNIPIRNENISNRKCPDVLDKSFTKNHGDIEMLKEMIAKYKENKVTVELMTHPGLIDEYTKTVTSYLDRQLELSALKEAMDRGMFNGIELINFQQL